MSPKVIQFTRVQAVASAGDKYYALVNVAGVPGWAGHRP